MALHIDPTLQFSFEAKRCVVTGSNGESYEIDFKTDEELEQFRKWVDQYRQTNEPHHDEFVPLLKDKGVMKPIETLDVSKFPTIVIFGPRAAEASLAKKLAERGVKDVRIAKKAKDFSLGVALIVRTKEFEKQFQEATKYCIEHEIPMLSVFMDEENNFGIVGPFHQPKKNACPLCIKDRIPAEKVTVDEKSITALRNSAEFQEKILHTAANELVFSFSGTGQLKDGILNFYIDSIDAVHEPVKPNNECECRKPKVKKVMTTKKSQKTGAKK